MKIGYLGPESSFSYHAAKRQFDTADLVAYASIPACLQAALQAEVDLAIVPIENSLEGSVHATIDTLSQNPELQVLAEVILPIKQQLLAVNPADFQKIYSHPQALAQSQKFLATNYPLAELIPTASTAAACEYVAKQHADQIAAIASFEAASAYGLEIVSSDIQDNDFNQTRFWIVSPKKAMDFGCAEKMSLILTLPSNQAGALHQMLATFGWRQINLSKIESRPLKTSLGEYFFVVDLLLNRPSELIENAIEEIELLGGMVVRLGAYSVTITSV
ncbi:prephenate dehydratase [Enterococcus dispar]|uniref:prephenate dehydratase n=1 Tax=Enterococcus dispar TaxID=44009 RepID=UPI00232AA11D|nr:prephenate dehydratase [Enterococcus dispar]WCG33343.1 prephenate dehydratase [Enterococcus dispar]